MMKRLGQVLIFLLLSLSSLSYLVSFSKSEQVNASFTALQWPDIAFQAIATGLNNPLGITDPGDGSGRLFITEQNGRILIYDGTKILPAPFLNISSIVSCCGERGLLGLAFHPEYSTKGFFYVNYTNTSGNTVIARYSVSNNPNVADPSSARRLLTFTQPASNHNGGHLAFGPDGYLYIASGDGGGSGDPNDNGQDLGTLLGKILRIDVDGDDFPGDPNRNYSIPSDNPFVGDPDALDEIWAYGLRNPWRFSFDRETGDLFTGDVGQNSREEVNFQPASSTGGENYGWRCYEGNAEFNLDGCGEADDYVFPIIDYTHAQGCSVTGGYRYRGPEPVLFGYYFYGDFCTGLVWGALPDENSDWATTPLLDTNLSISTFGEDEAGNLYIAHYHGARGAIYRIIEASCDCNDPNAINGDENDNMIDGTPGNDIICGHSGNDTIRGLGGNDCIDGGDGNDTIRGNTGGDVLLGGVGDDTLIGGRGHDTLDGGDGDDVLKGDKGGDVLNGGPETDNLNGGPGIDACIGGETNISCGN